MINHWFLQRGPAKAKAMPEGFVALRQNKKKKVIFTVKRQEKNGSVGRDFSPNSNEPFGCHYASST